MNVKFPESFPVVALIKFAADHECDVRLRPDGSLVLKSWNAEEKKQGNVIQFRGKGA